MKGVKKFGKGPKFAHGGSGIVISSGAIKKMLINLDKCIVKYRTCWAGDIRTALCLRDNDILIKGIPGFNNNPLQLTNLGPPCQTPITFHHLLGRQMQDIWDVDSRLHLLNKTRVTNSDIYNILNAKEGEEYLEGIDMPGSDIKHLNSPNSISCLASCRNETKCIAYSYVEGVCWLKNSMVEREERNGSISGFLSDRYVCKS